MVYGLHHRIMIYRLRFIVCFSATLLAGCRDNSTASVADAIVFQDVLDKPKIRQCDGDALLRALQERTEGFTRLEGRCPLALAYLLSIHKSEYAFSVVEKLREQPNDIAQSLADVYAATDPQSTVKDVEYSIHFVEKYRGGYPDWNEVHAFLISVEALRQFPDEVVVKTLQNVLPRLNRKNEIDAVEDALRTVRGIEDSQQN